MMKGRKVSLSVNGWGYYVGEKDEPVYGTLLMWGIGKPFVGTERTVKYYADEEISFRREDNTGTIAIVELKDGRVVKLDPSHIRFIDRKENTE